MTFIQAVTEAAYQAGLTQEIHYVYKDQMGDCYAAKEYRADWLWKIYPGGRKEYSPLGKKEYYG